MRIILSSILTATGLVAVFFFGLPRIYSESANAWIAAFLIFAGGITALCGSTLVFCESRVHQFFGMLLHLCCFFGCIGLIIYGLLNVFESTRTVGSIYLLVIGFLGAFASGFIASNISRELWGQNKSMDQRY